MNKFVDVYWSFRSPFSYLATPEMIQLAQDYDVDVRLRVVFPIAIRDPDFFNPDNAKRAKYILIDWPRRAEMLGLPHAWPSPDPIVQDLETFRIAKEQPYIYRLSYLGVEAQRRNRGIFFAAEVSRMIFGGTVNWHTGDHLYKAAARAGLDLQEMERAISDSESYRKEIENNQSALEKAGHWGVPTFVYNNEPFFGQDRIDTLRWRLDQYDLKVQNATNQDRTSASY